MKTMDEKSLHVASETIHLPDLHFTRWCEQQFAINRGVYNLIDERLYELGYVNIIERRTLVVKFLADTIQQPSKEPFKFGAGNLSKAIGTYFIQK